MTDETNDQALQIERLTQERDEAIARADKAEKALEAHKVKAAKVTAAPAGSGVPRVLKPIADDKQLSREDLRAAVAGAEKVEIAFSDGKKEVRGLAPVIVSGNAWKDHVIGLMLTEAVDLQGPAVGGGAYSIEGYALLLDGKQVAFTKREPLMVGGGQHVRLTDDIAF